MPVRILESTSKRAYVHLLTDGKYLPGVLVMHKSHLDTKSRYSFVVMLTPGVDQSVRAALQSRGIIVKDIEYLRPPASKHQLNDYDKRFSETWAKLRVFELVEYERVILRDIDMLLLKNMDDLFDLSIPHDHIAATHACSCNLMKFRHYPSDWVPANCPYTPLTWPSCLDRATAVTKNSPRCHHLLNGGLVLLHPSLEMARHIQNALYTSPQIRKYRFPDQDLLADVFKNKWVPLPYVYNAMKHMRIAHKDIWRDADIKCLHYVMDKPWQYRPLPPSATSGVQRETQLSTTLASCKAGGSLLEGAAMRRIQQEFDELVHHWWAAFDELELEMSGSEHWDVIEENVNRHPVSVFNAN
ncbi:nucleotide-diphospho-sugar transferase [Cantharellus anzutake]|uniref:nucleotide-diphospho-sugar transferase n=1 Tax=Cantharellus anzutake TaxID=1750568 RepID=UPI001905A1B3|nr:nucleotide-diphospho-sugar transferase [Cantharellus anzutake]KAF8330417.1 nucleotide-diphospho-sugar transferase [Cantharellus anzutake]